MAVSLTRWPPELYADDGDGPARDPTEDERAGVKELGPYATKVAKLYADAEPVKRRSGPTTARVFYCKRKLDDGTVCGARFEAFAYRAKYCPTCKPAMQMAWKDKHERGKMKP